MNDHPPSARTWANTTRRGLSIELMRFANEIRIRPGGKLVSFDDLEDGPVRTLLYRNSISHPRYLAQQISAADVPVGRTCYFESKNFDSHTPQGFAHFRDELIDGMRTWTFLPMYLADEADAREKVSAIAGRRRVVPSYTEEDRQRFKGSLAAMRRVLNAH